MEWISVKDRLPDKEGFYLVYSPIQQNNHVLSVDGGRAVHMSSDLHIDIFFENGFLKFVTHWMPLPKQPKE